ncbi:MBL fold metallo-hydrolase [Caldimonas tepidiphila]|uniref:MBL fold metallo-hydrolase n=1 Tax=Caldimonas tepidiphila TaxID=2315841 RepID=UPI000E5C4127|nr:MBL fold metallo-hydrolase [Caldimonas tepidiphila]
MSLSSTRIDEISADVFRISTYLPDYNLEFNQFLVRDEQPLLYHTGMNLLFPVVREAVAKLIAPEDLRWVGFSHFEQDECGSLNEWLAIAPDARPVCNMLSALVNVNDVTRRENPFMEHGEVFSTGRKRFRFLSTPHVPHCWDASLLFEETQGVLFCSDLFSHSGEQPALAPDIAARAHDALLEEQQGPFRDSMAYNAHTDAILSALAELEPAVLAVMHGSSHAGNGAAALQELRRSLRTILGAEPGAERARG